eukprot:6203394-Pleurochrysis_carterae.AAC.1
MKNKHGSYGKTSLQVGEAPVGAPGVARHSLLREEASGGEHSQAAVLELLGLHGNELLLGVRLEAERVEAEVAGRVCKQAVSQTS